MLNSDQVFGRRGEDAAARRLEELGYRIEGRNVRTPAGEIDIVARDGACLVFVEVKARRSDRFGPPKAAVDRRKQRKLWQCAQHYLKSAGRNRQRARFDVVSVTPMGEGLRVEVLRNAFGFSG
ncbi:MAG: YraN family protein [Desulfococcaceae bacterium]